VTKILPISEVKTRLPELVTNIEGRDDQVVVTRKGKPAVVIVSYDQFERLRETLDVLGDPAMMRQLRKSLAYFAKGGKGRTFDDVFGEPLRSSRPAHDPLARPLLSCGRRCRRALAAADQAGCQAGRPHPRRGAPGRRAAGAGA